MQKTILNMCGRSEIGQRLAASASEYVLVTGTYHDGRIARDDFAGVFLVVIDDNEWLAGICADDRLPTSVPLLLFYTGGVMPPLASGQRFIDALPWPCPDILIGHKLAFLRQLSRFCQQREIFLKTNDALIDSLSHRDGLTGLYNRHHLLHLLEDELDKVRTRNDSLAFLILDPDNLRQINRSYGYSFGDSFLGELSARISDAVKDEGGVCCRYSGANFAVVLPRAGADDAMRCAERIRMACSAKRFRRGRYATHITLSIGIASFRENQPENSEQFIAMAETALYQAKNDGRNRIRVFSEKICQHNIASNQGISMLKFTINSLLQDMRAAVVSSLMSLTRDLGNNEQRRHSALVSRYLALMVKDLALPVTMLKVFENTANLLTCMRVSLQQDILAESGGFMDVEQRLMRELPYKTAELTQNFDFFLLERTLLMTQGECYDGSGGPHGLKGEEIPSTARLFKLVDAFAAMTSDRPHRGKLTSQTIIDELAAQAGLQFDPAMVMQLFATIERHCLLTIDGAILREARLRLRERFPDIDETRIGHP